MRLKFLIIGMFLFGILSFAQENASSIGTLPSAVSETSGLIYFDGKLITHNDSGNAAQLFEIDTLSLEITRTVTITNVENKDWEDITQDDQYIYIGDFGNNLGLRNDLSIHRIPKLAYNTETEVEAETINFNYEDQVDFGNTGNSDWDAEAFFVLDDQLIILTKQWQSLGTVAYMLPKVPGTYEAQRIDSFDSEGLVTGATYNTASGTLFIIGYSLILQPFVIQVDGLTNISIFNDSAVRTDLNIGLAQTEAIAFVDADSYFFSSEFFSRTNPSISFEPQLFRFDTIGDAPEEPEPEPEPEKKNIELFQRPGFELLEYTLVTTEPLMARGIYDASGKQIRYVLGNGISDDVDISTLQHGIYYIAFYFEKEIVALPFLRN